MAASSNWNKGAALSLSLLSLCLKSNRREWGFRHLFVTARRQLISAFWFSFSICLLQILLVYFYRLLTPVSLSCYFCVKYTETFSDFVDSLNIPNHLFRNWLDGLSIWKSFLRRSSFRLFFLVVLCVSFCFGSFWFWHQSSFVLFSDDLDVQNSEFCYNTLRWWER